MVKIIQTKTVDDNNKLKILKENFHCDRYCGHCCKMVVRITDEEINKLENIGKKNFYEKDLLEGKILKHKDDGYCIFHKLQKDGKHVCTIYNNRPKPCKDYPFFGNIILLSLNNSLYVVSSPIHSSSKTLPVGLVI